MQRKNDFESLLLKQFHDNKLGHAFLIETNNQEESLNKVLHFLRFINCEQSFEDNCQRCNLCHLIVSDMLPSLKIISPSGNVIKKEQILELKHSFQTRPIFSIYNMYIILDAQYLNDSSANTMLKFLEEPNDNIIGFFLTNNKENVIDTIKSRCQIFLDYYDSSEDLSNYEEMAISFIASLEKDLDNGLLYSKDLALRLSLKEDLVCFLKELMVIYQELFRSKVLNSGNSYQQLNFILVNDSEFFLKRLNLLNTLIDSVFSNLSNVFVLDWFVLEVSL